ncbi:MULTISPECIES: peptidoglycan DD-metalloendopeptidase family protein [Halomonadaceae]|uniref:Peptidoglycan DD-metalloendopeptidase family protein n=1 Tax=Vreelandella piezotolerans TaxID=2609667 RepID=A0ABQ6X6Q9_9GAMM|nr:MULTISPECIES: peptidoglycan DD-metalloendopeptidase family protein [Halomonas]KAE8437723.1 peptidoglycan DD-metalloendopeptidase family protein [Halomonas piezotolerans]MCG7577253.1 peptidoglycan DD-metalloendopeptidase family protein [Halomonas sp. MMH1-48]MCG7591614.1 peptidoglycan DD-metalloendopeptidase family protein [Halomonas sp. McD50-5]MCG7604318.1 peptidoglycan DD-metalloendopeptidase family protein [Halomonas sp. MM17-34]MCG7613673.1 peptidoglycan DD-metalloendopeptidase family p
MPMWRPLALAALLLALSQQPALAQQNERAAREQLDALGQEIDAMAERLSATGQARDSAQRELQAVETELAETHQRLDQLQAERRQLNDETTQLRQHRERLQSERESQYQALGQQLAALYRLGPTPQLKLLLNQSDPAELDRMQAYLNRLTQARQQRLTDIARLDTALADTERALAERQARLDTLANELETQSALLAERTEARRGVVETLDDRYGSEADRLADLNQSREQAEQQLRAIQAELARMAEPTPTTHITRTQGDLPWPVQGSITASFQRRNGVHYNGIVIQASEGTAVTAVHSGRVVFADWMRGFGNLLIIDHGDQIMTLYAHLQQFSARPGQQVSRGDAIGRVGNSGGQSRPALYFEVRRGGEPINPQRWIARR